MGAYDKNSGGEARTEGGSRRMNKDKGIAPGFHYQDDPEDGENINVPPDAMGEPVAIFAARNNLESKGEANYPGKFKPVIGRDNLLKAEPGFAKTDAKGVE